ncbi:MAG: beta-lactamase family protein [Chloroflexi bacterium]|nr:beta-lactamase family protein [Chloroflexota bacterium]
MPHPDALAGALAEVDAIFDRFAASDAVPGFAYGIVVNGELVHSGGRGTLRAGAAVTPNADSVFRIASMTKSFTAATVMLLRDEGRLRLDDPVATWVPELAGLVPWSRDSAPMTIESLLTMSAGLPTDDPWGDRLQDQDPSDFLAFLTAGPGLLWPVGTHFEYANLGFAILGLIIGRVTGDDYRAIVERRILEPLGMASTTFTSESVRRDRLALGYVRRNDLWIDEPMAGHGAFAPMGGLFTSVRDLARWVGGFTAAFPPRDDDPGGPDRHPLSRATRREMQQLHRPTSPDLTWESAGSVPSATIGGYGYGLFAYLDLTVGRIVAHGGGYPGFGSHMRWHPATGIGVVGLANARYGGIVEPTREALRLLIERGVAPVHRPIPWPATDEARLAVERLLEAWDDDLAAGLFAPNVALDEDLSSRRAAVAGLRAEHGRLRDDEATPVERWSAAHLAWWLNGERGRVRVEILMSPDRPPRVQSLILTSVPAPSAALTAHAARIVGLLDARGPAWPNEIPLADDVDRPALDRELRAAEALFGPVTLGPPTAGDGAMTADWLLQGDRGDLTLTVELEKADGPIAKVSLVPVSLESPVHLA